MADNTTRLKILAQVEGVQGFDSLKRSLQGLAQQGQGTQRDLFRLAAVYKELKSGGDSTISGMRQQVAVLTQLRESVSTTGTLYKRWGAELDQVQGKLRALAQAERGAAQARPAAAVGGGMGLAGLAGQFAPQLAVGAAVAGIATAGVSAESAQVRLKALTDQFGEYNEAQAAAARIAGTLRMSTAESQQSFATLYASLRPTGITIKELEDTLIGFSAAARNSGATAQETSNALIQLKQGLASGTLQGEELRSIREQAPLAAQAIAKEMGTTIGNLKNLAAEGKVTTDVVIRAMGRLKEEQLGKLNAQFNTAEQAMTDMKNAAVDAGSAISKLFGPTVIAGLRLLTGAIKSVTNELKFRTREEEIQQKARVQAAADVQKRFPGIEGATAITPRARAFFDERTRQIEARLRQQPTGIPALTPEQRADQEAARQERLRAGQAGAGAGAGKAKEYSGRIIEYLTGDPSSKYYDPRGHGGANYHEHLAFSSRKERDLAMRALRAEGIQIGSIEGGRHAPGSYHYSSQAFDVPASQVPVGQEPGLSARVRRILASAGFTGKGMEGLTSSKGYGEAAGDIAIKELDIATRKQAEAKKLAEQRAKEQKDTIERNNKLAEQAQQQEDSYFASLQTTKDQARLLQIMTQDQQLLEEFANNILNIERDTAKAKADALTEDAAALAVADGELKKQNALNKLYQDQAALESAAMSESWAQQQETLQGTLTSYYQQQADLLGEQNQLAVSLSQSIGQGLQQAFSLAIQGTEDWGASLKNLASGVLQDIAQQLLQIAVITPIVNSIAGIGARGITPIAPGISALPGGDFAGAFTGGGGMSFTAGLPAAAMTPGAFQFATGGIMTSQGAVPLRRYARGGIATAPQAAIYGDGATPEAFVPLPDGRRIPVALRQYPGIPGAPGAGGSFEQTDAVVQRLVETARQESAVRAAAGPAAGPDGTMRIQIETTRINSIDYVTAEQAQALAQAAATRSTARQQRALQGSPAARRSVGI